MLPPAPAKLRVLETADRLFYNEGIRAVGIDRLIKESSVTKATFYKHYGSKDRLIVEYVAARDRETRLATEQLLLPAESPADALSLLTESIVNEIQSVGFRGCAFINAATEFTDVTHPVRSIVIAHRDWLGDLVAGLYSQLGHPLPGDASDEFVLARDGAMTGGYAGDPIAAATALQRAVERIGSAAA